jgi:hypothetical protein
VADALEAARADQSTRELWSEIHTTFEGGGPDAVKDLVRMKVRESRLRAEKEVKAVRSAASAVAKPKRVGKRRRA